MLVKNIVKYMRKTNTKYFNEIQVNGKHNVNLNIMSASETPNNISGNKIFLEIFESNNVNTCNCF